jgi:transcriptional regulator with XRE-family HTH domain
MNVTGFDVKKLRDDMEWSQLTLSMKLGVVPSTIINYERGGNIPKAKKEMLAKLIMGEGSPLISHEKVFVFKLGDKTVTSVELMNNEKFLLWLKNKEQAAEIRVLMDAAKQNEYKY